MKVTARIRGTSFQNYMRKGKGRTEETLRLFKERGPKIVVPEMRNRIPFGKTGLTKETVNSRETPYGFTVYSDSQIVRFLDQGTKPHIIEPKTTKSLRWFGVWGNAIFAKRVKHPGTKPLFIVQKTREAVKGRIRDLLSSIWREVHGNG